MYGLDIFIFFLIIIGPQSVFGDLECVIRNDLKSSDLGIRSTALNGLKIDGGRNKTHPQVFQCHCGSDIVNKYMIFFLIFWSCLIFQRIYNILTLYRKVLPIVALIILMIDSIKIIMSGPEWLLPPIFLWLDDLQN